ncbi:MAG: Bro-N domain-containing protein [Pseudomonadota bacterium]|nr:Bro-N domain-containing protein [Pseudomonadota bacterium]
MSLSQLHSAKNPMFLRFHTMNFKVIDHKGRPWLLPEQIGEALDLETPRKSLLKIYYRHQDEFGPDETAEIEMDMDVANPDYRPQIGDGSRQKNDTHTRKLKVRIFSLRGAYHLGFFARTDVAKEFRQWVLDQLEMKGEEHSFYRPYRDLIQYELNKHPRWEKVRGGLRIGSTTNQIAESCGCSASTIRRDIREIRKAGIIQVREYQRWIEFRQEFQLELKRIKAKRQGELF